MSSAMPGWVESHLKHIRLAGYLILALAALFPMIEVMAGIWPFQFGNATWRYGAAGLMSNYAMGASIELFLLVLLAVLARQRRVTITFGVVAAVLAVVLLGAAGMFVLDALQTRARVVPAAIRRYDVATAGALAKMLLFSLANGLLARGALMAARLEERASRQKGPAAPILVARPVSER